MRGKSIRIFNIVVVFIFLLATISTFSCAADQTVINSRDWKDVYTGILYSELTSSVSNILIDETRNELLISTLNKEKENVLLFESESEPYIKNFDVNLNNAGFVVEKFEYDNLNLDLIRSQEIDTKKFIILDERYPYNAISVASYASNQNYYVIFADNTNIDEIVDLLDSISAEEIIIYGYVDREVTVAMTAYNPTVINKGNKYDNNLEIVNLFMEKNTASQFVLTNGNFIEPQFFNKNFPVVFIGNSNTPETTLEFLRNSKVTHGILVGNDLVPLATQLKDQTGMKMMVKYAKGIQQTQYTLDIIELPKPDYNVIVSEIIYNSVNGELIVSLENTGESPVMIKGSYTISSGDTTIGAVGDEQVIFIPGNGIITLTYEIDLSQYTNTPVIAKSNILFGDDLASLDYLLNAETEVQSIRIQDNSKIEISDAYYDPSIGRFIIEVTNIGGSTVYATAFIENLLVNEKEETFSSNDIIEISSGAKASMKIKAKLTAEDIEDNPEIHVKVKYGAQKKFLMKVREMDTELVVKDNKALYIGIAAGVIVLIILLILLFGKKKKKRKSRHGRHPNTPPSPSHH